MLVNVCDNQVKLYSPTALPKASAFLWNKRMLLNVNCRGYVAAQFMQSSPAKYSRGPNIEAETFLQPEQPYYAHHPGRFFYVKDNDSSEIISLPYEPIRTQFEHFEFIIEPHQVTWKIRHADINYSLTCSISAEEVVELWCLQIENNSTQSKRLSIYPCFSVGYLSWMNQSAGYNENLTAVVASCVSPYQKLGDYPEIKTRMDKTFLLADRQPCAWDTNREVFEGEGSLHKPSAIQSKTLFKSSANYETPIAVLQFDHLIPPAGSEAFRFLFGPAKSQQDIQSIKTTYFDDEPFFKPQRTTECHQNAIAKALISHSPNTHLDSFVNHWLPRQVYYHGDINRLTNDPQTRNFLQDGMGMTYVDPDVTRKVFLKALSQQKQDGAMPDGIILNDAGELQYINQIPHADHCVWLAVCIETYLDETDDYAFLEIKVRSVDESEKTVFTRITDALLYLCKQRDARGLCYIAQGDWCDPMNMVGHRGKGVSGWLSIATIHALKIWIKISMRIGKDEPCQRLQHYVAELEACVEQHLWRDNWFARGITDDGQHFGVSHDKEGKIYLNPQSWALMAGIVSPKQQQQMVAAIEKYLQTPYGVSMLAPAYTQMREDIGRITQKSPGVAENGSIYNHAAIFYVYALYCVGDNDRAFHMLSQMLPGPSEADYRRRGQLPIFIPNYYRGAFSQFPEECGRSSQLFNTGTVAWYYRCVIEKLYGLFGTREGLCVSPQLPSHWETARAQRCFRGATVDVHYRVDETCEETQIRLDGDVISGNILPKLKPNAEYRVDVTLQRT